ncbi:hypothetical protein P43SY_010710 [Pythium insidiosum]|uniref:Uncharacterized protein n=1 Tax=Pythium insidiosum TaxID=114742 RepID=A0AAD5L7F7_PYTIN|nr:hypothetical protein P43SY_010710 [Pythium insidiosum]
MSAPPPPTPPAPTPAPAAVASPAPAVAVAPPAPASTTPPAGDASASASVAPSGVVAPVLRVDVPASSRSPAPSPGSSTPVSTPTSILPPASAGSTALMSVFADLIASSGVSLNPPNLHLAREELAQRVTDFLDQRVSVDVGQLQVNWLDPVCELVGSALAVPADDVEADVSRLLLLDRRVDTPVDARRQALEEVADALRLYSSLR